MARIRTIKPDFFRNEQLAELPYEDRLLFIGLWTLADRAGRLEDRPKRIRAELFPYDTFDAELSLSRLSGIGLITRYESDGRRVIAITAWVRHQVPGRDEPPSEFFGPCGEVDLLGRAPNETVRYGIYVRDSYTCVYCGRDMATDLRSRCVDHVIPLARGGSHQTINLVTSCKRCNAKKGSLTPDEAGMRWPEGFGHTVNGVMTERRPPADRKGKERELDRELEMEKEGNGLEHATSDRRAALRDRFEAFWAAYPRKVGKDAAFAVWSRRAPSADLTSEMIAAVRAQETSAQWQREGGRYIPHPRTWLNQGRWQDSVDHAGADDGLSGLREAVRHG